MELRKLKENERNSTRKLWEDIFVEDTEEFLDYYYFLKTKDNEIYVIEEEHAIRSMLHLNPYTVNIEDTQFIGHYIVAVATEDNYRKRGYMGRLLRETMQEMYDRKEPFTFLMPAVEAIYSPYDFRYVYKQRRTKSAGKPGVPKIELKIASVVDTAEMAAFYKEHFADRYQVYAERDKKYYMTVLMEQQSQFGGIMLMKHEGEIVGMFFYTNEGEFAVREPLYLQEFEEEFYKAIHELKGNQELVQIDAVSESEVIFEEQPIIMARILHLESMLSSLRTKNGEQVNCSFAVLDTILKKNSRIWRIASQEDGKIKVTETEDSEGVLTIAAFTSFVFGYKTIDEIKKEPDVFLSERLENELKKIKTINRVFLNEVV